MIKWTYVNKNKNTIVFGLLRYVHFGSEVFLTAMAVLLTFQESILKEVEKNFIFIFRIFQYLSIKSTESCLVQNCNLFTTRSAMFLSNITNSLFKI